jgi:hypothetical protein
MYVSMTLPQVVLGPLREGAYLALQRPVEEIAEILSGEGSEDRRCRESLIDSHARLMQVRLLLNAIGWREGEAPAESTIDLSEHGAGLARALDYAIVVGMDGLDHPERQVCGQVREALYTLCGFAAVIDEADIKRSQNHPNARTIHEHGAQLLGELEDETAQGPQPQNTIH